MNVQIVEMVVLETTWLRLFPFQWRYAEGKTVVEHSGPSKQYRIGEGTANEQANKTVNTERYILGTVADEQSTLAWHHFDYFQFERSGVGR